MGQSQVSAKPQNKKGFKEFVRKFLVSIKRQPQNIAIFYSACGICLLLAEPHIDFRHNRAYQHREYGTM